MHAPAAASPGGMRLRDTRMPPSSPMAVRASVAATMISQLTAKYSVPLNHAKSFADFVRDTVNQMLQARSGSISQQLYRQVDAQVAVAAQKLNTSANPASAPTHHAPVWVAEVHAGDVEQPAVSYPEPTTNSAGTAASVDTPTIRHVSSTPKAASIPVVPAGGVRHGQRPSTAAPILSGASRSRLPQIPASPMTTRPPVFFADDSNPSGPGTPRSLVEAGTPTYPRDVHSATGRRGSKPTLPVRPATACIPASPMRFTTPRLDSNCFESALDVSEMRSEATHVPDAPLSMLPPLSPTRAGTAVLGSSSVSPTRGGKFEEAMDLVSETIRMQQQDLRGYALPSPTFVLKHYKKAELRENLDHQVVEQEATRKLYSRVDAAFADAGKEMAARAERAVSAAATFSKLAKEDASQHVKRVISEHEEARERERREQLATEARIIEEVQSALKAEAEAQKRAREREREEMRAAYHASQVEAARRLAREREQLLSSTAVSIVAINECDRSAFGSKAKAVVERTAKQEQLAKHLATLYSEKEAQVQRLATLSDKYAKDRTELETARDAARAEAASARAADVSRTLRSMMLEKKSAQSAELTEYRTDGALAASIGAADRAERDKLTLEAHRRARQYYKDLRVQVAERNDIKSPDFDAYESMRTTGWVFPTSASDHDTENALRRELKIMQSGASLQRINNSEAVAPLVGFAAPFVTSIETAAGATRPHTAPSITRRQTAASWRDPPGMIKPSRASVPLSTHTIVFHAPPVKK